MKINTITLFSIGILATFFSCAPIYQCGDERPERPVGGSNRLLAVVQERDNLCDELAIKTEESQYFLARTQRMTVVNDSLTSIIGDLNRQLGDKSNELKTLQTQHEALQKEHMEVSQKYALEVGKSVETGYYYNSVLKDKEERLAAKEAEILAKEAELAKLQAEALALLNGVKEREKRIAELEAEIARQDSITKRLNNLIHEALLGFNSDELSTEIRDGKVYVLMSDKLMFKSGKADVEAKGIEALGLLASVLNKNSDFDILVEGHTDNVPIKNQRYKDNWDLSVDRATSIVRVLQQNYGISPLRLTASGRGEYFPRASNDTNEGKAKNRRTEIILSPKLGDLLDIIKD